MPIAIAGTVGYTAAIVHSTCLRCRHSGPRFCVTIDWLLIQQRQFRATLQAIDAISGALAHWLRGMAQEIALRRFSFLWCRCASLSACF